LCLFLATNNMCSNDKTLFTSILIPMVFTKLERTDCS
jgi:hypothetical protein